MLNHVGDHLSQVLVNFLQIKKFPFWQKPVSDRAGEKQGPSLQTLGFNPAQSLTEWLSPLIVLFAIGTIWILPLLY